MKNHYFKVVVDGIRYFFFTTESAARQFMTTADDGTVVRLYDRQRRDIT